MRAICIRAHFISGTKTLVVEDTIRDIDPKSPIAIYYGKIPRDGEFDPREHPVMTQEEYFAIKRTGGFGNGRKLLKKLEKDSSKNANQISILADGLAAYEKEKAAADQKAAKAAADQAAKEAKEAADQADLLAKEAAEKAKKLKAKAAGGGSAE